MVSPMLERDPSDGQITVAATEMRVAVTPWGSITPREIDGAFVTISVERASLSGVLTREECLAFAQQFTEAAAAIPERVAA